VNNDFVLAGADPEQHVEIVTKGRQVTVTRDDTFAVVRVGDKAIIQCADGDVVMTSRIACSKLAAAAVTALALLVSS
jgi:hypothetical protein